MILFSIFSALNGKKKCVHTEQEVDVLEKFSSSCTGMTLRLHRDSPDMPFIPHFLDRLYFSTHRTYTDSSTPAPGDLYDDESRELR